MKVEAEGKDPRLTGIYVKRCKCGKRPYLDRVACGNPYYWIKCDPCDKKSISEDTVDETVDNWNKDKLFYPTDDFYKNIKAIKAIKNKNN